MVKKLVAILATALLLSGCAATGGGDEKFIADVESYVGAADGSLSEHSQELLVEIAHGICSGLEDGRTTTEVESLVTKLGLDAKYSGQIVSAAITNYCPR